MNKSINKTKRKKAIVLLSGGLDSAVSLYLAQKRGYKTFALTFDYGQRHKKEIKAAEKIAQIANCKWQMLKIFLPWKGSSLLDKNMLLPENRNLTRGIPNTYVPARNIVFLSLAASFAEVVGAEAIFIGVNEIDFSGYPDCRSEFLKAFEKALARGTKTGVEHKSISIIAPLARKNKAQIVKLAEKLKVPVAFTWSCYKGARKPCGVCDSCLFRRRGFLEAKINDPAYA